MLKYVIETSGHVYIVEGKDTFEALENFSKAWFDLRYASSFSIKEVSASKINGVLEEAAYNDGFSRLTLKIVPAEH